MHFVSQYDTEVVLHALHRWGPHHAVPRFNGMFALAWHDLRDASLWLARDRTGIKPLFYADRGATLAFAFEAKALFGHPDVPRRPDLHSLVIHAWMERLAGDWTGFEGVRRLEPGAMLRYSGSSVEAHLHSDAPLAVRCSGGLDSSLTAALAVRHQPGLVAYVAEVEGVKVSEADNAQIVADHLHVPLRRIPITDAEFPDLWARAAWHNDHPMYFVQNPLALKVFEAVRDDGFEVLVTGEGPDELFGGYNWQSRAGAMWQRRRWHARVWPIVAPFRQIGRWMQKWLVPVDLDLLAVTPFPLRGAEPMSTAAPLLLDGGIREQRAARLFAQLAPLRRPADRAFRARAFDDVYHHLRVLLHSNDNMSMAASVEARVPFRETALIDFGLHHTPSAKRHRGITKHVVKEAALPLLPHGIVYARKIGFGFSDRMLDGYAGFLQGGLLPEWFKWGRRERSALNQLLAEHRLIARRLVSLELWAQMHFNGKHPAQLAEELRACRRL